MAWNDPIRNIYDQVKSKAAAARNRITPPPVRGQVDAHNVEIRRRGDRVSQVDIDGEHFVRGRRSYWDLSRGKQAVLGTAYASRAGAAGGVAYPLHNLCESIDALIMAAVSGVRGGSEIAKEAANLVGQFFNTGEREALRNIESLMQQGSLDAGSYQTAENYLTNFAGYKATHAIIDRARA